MEMADSDKIVLQVDPQGEIVLVCSDGETWYVMFLTKRDS